MNLRYHVFHEHPQLYLGSASVLTSLFALTAFPSFLPLVIHLSILLIYAPKMKAILPVWIGLSLGRSVSWIAPSISALDTPPMAVLVLLSQSMITSTVSLAAVLVYSRLRTRIPTGGAQIALFPALWTGIWCGAAYISPVGYLTSWTPVGGLGFYEWLIPFLGPAVKDWVTAAWAVVCSQAVEEWYMDSRTEEEAPLLLVDGIDSQTHPEHKSWFQVEYWKPLAIFLVLLSVPSYFDNNGPLPVISPQTTPFAVGCALPPFQTYKHYTPTVQDFLKETQTLVSQANLILWPEGAVSFHNESERDNIFNKIKEEIPNKKWIGVAFDEISGDPGDPLGERGIKRTGLALLSKHETHFTYYKRHLVPIAESYSMRGSTEPPTITTLHLEKPESLKIPKADWAPGPDYTRPISVTASICLDFAIPGTLSGLDSRPALILAPGRTWEATVGEVMWSQAKQRAHELGSTVLWCDGGTKGLSGIAGRGMSESIQVGHGSWVRRIGLPYPFDESRTLYGRGGNYFVLLLLSLPFVLSVPGSVVWFLPGNGIGWALRAINRWRARRIEDAQPVAEHADLI